MKHIFLSIFILALATSQCSAQWMNAYFPNPQAFGAYDTSFFGSRSDYSKDPGGVFRLEPTLFEADSGMNGAGILVTAFGSIGSYVLAAVNLNGTGGAYRSSNDGESWFATNAQQSYCFVNNGGNIYSGGSGGVYRSTDSGMNWTDLSTSPPNVTSLAFVGTTFFAGTTGGIFRSTDSGNSWKSTSMKTATSALAVVGTIIIAATDGSGIFRSTDEGVNWSQDDSGLFNFAVNSIVTDGKNLFVGTGLKSGAPNGDFDEGSGVFLSTDSGATWDTVNNGLIPGPIYADDYLSVNALGIFDTLLFVGVWDGAGVNNRTYVRSIKEILKKDTTEGVVQTVHSADSIEIYPNPTTGNVTILSGGTSICGVSVLNVLGEDVLDVPNSRESEVSLDLSKLPAGTYFLRIETMNGSDLRKVVIQH
jgi:Secretion system C-terminal sorting domain